MMIQDIHDIIKNNNNLIREFYSDTYFDVSFDHEECCIFIYTKYKRSPGKKHEEKIRRIFNAKDVVYIEGMPASGKDKYDDMKPFWSVKLW